MISLIHEYHVKVNRNNDKKKNLIILIIVKKRPKHWFGGRHVLIYHNKDRLGTGLQLIVAGHDDDEDEVHKRADNDD